MRRPGATLAVMLCIVACGGGRHEGCGKPPLEALEASQAATLAPGNEAGQDEDPAVLVTRLPDALYAAWYSNRLGAHPDGLARKEILVTRSTDGKAWSTPVAATDAQAWSFYPSLAREPNGVFHLAWMRWRLLPEGCIYFDAAHCPGTPGCCTGTDRRIWQNVSFDGLAFDEASAIAISPGPDDQHPAMVATSDGRMLVYFTSGYRAGDTRRRIDVAVRDAAGWHAPVEAAGLASGSNDAFPHVVERGPGEFLMAFTRHDLALGENVLDRSAETMLSTSADGLTWTAPVVASGPDAAHTDVFPWLFAERNGTWSVAWVREDGTVVRPVAGPFTGEPEHLPVPGYTPRIVRTPTPEIVWAVWVEGMEPTQQVRYRFLER
ncbi:MAG: sialidase family protein [Anaeromyxobacteraceae bacterium]